MKVKDSELVAAESIKNRLQNTWSFWMFTNDKKKWEENLVELTTFDTVEDYWCLYHHMKTPSELKLGQDYAIFKKGIRPMWEDSSNRYGGRWFITFDNKCNTDLDNVWLYTVLLLIGENFQNSDQICGVIVGGRTKRKIGIWIKNAWNEKAKMEIGYKLKERLGSVKLAFNAHCSMTNLYTI